MDGPTRTAASPVRSARNAAFDGLRGVAILLVILGHAGSIMWPDLVALESGPYGVPLLRGLLGGGAVLVFFVVGGFIVTVGLGRERERGTLDPSRFIARRLVRLGGQLVLLALVLVVVQLIDPTAPGTLLDLVRNLGHVLTYTLNLAVTDPTFVPRADVGHLWYLSVQQQCYLLLPLFLLTFGRSRIVGATLLVLLIALVYHHRQVVNEESGWILATVLTTTRADGLLWRVLLALALPLLGKFRGWAWVLPPAALACLVTQLLIQEIPPLAYLGPWSLVYQFLIGVVLVALWLQHEPSLTSRLLGMRPLAWLGRNSLSLYFWHAPVFFLLARHFESASWWVLALLGVALVGAVTLVLEKVVEQPTRRLLATHPFFRAQAARQ